MYSVKFFPHVDPLVCVVNGILLAAVCVVVALVWLESRDLEDKLAKV